MGGLLSLGRRFLARKCHASLICVLGFDAAERGDRGRHHDAIDGGDDREERNEIQQHGSARQFSRPPAGFPAGMGWKTAHHGPRKLSTGLACETSFESVMVKVSGTEAAGSGACVVNSARSSRVWSGLTTISGLPLATVSPTSVTSIPGMPSTVNSNSRVSSALLRMCTVK